LEFALKTTGAKKVLLNGKESAAQFEAGVVKFKLP
jgi:hypothetical protein